MAYEAMIVAGSNPAGGAKYGAFMKTSSEESEKNLRRVLDFLRDIKEENHRRAKEFEETYYKKFAFLPTFLSNGKLIWLKFYYVRYKAKKKDFLDVDVRGNLFVSDMYKHYIRHEFNKGKVLEKVQEL